MNPPTPINVGCFPAKRTIRVRPEICSNISHIAPAIQAETLPENSVRACKRAVSLTLLKRSWRTTTTTIIAAPATARAIKQIQNPSRTYSQHAALSGLMLILLVVTCGRLLHSQSGKALLRQKVDLSFQLPVLPLNGAARRTSSLLKVANTAPEVVATSVAVRTVLRERNIETELMQQQPAYSGGPLDVIDLSRRHVEPASNITAAVCFKTLFGDIDLGLVLHWVGTCDVSAEK